MRLDIPELSVSFKLPKRFSAICKISKVDDCCQHLPNDNGGLAEKKYCHALNFLKKKGVIKGFSHSYKNGKDDCRGIDFQIELWCGHILQRQITSSNNGKSRKLKRIKQKRAANLPIDIITPGNSIKDALLKIIVPTLKRHRFCSRPT